MAQSSSKLAWFTGDRFYDTYLSILIGISLALLSTARFQGRAPYGRFGQAKRHISLDPRLGWFLMELPATLGFLYGYIQGRRNRLKKSSNQDGGKSSALVGNLFCILWAVHYAYRGWYFPLNIRTAKDGTQSFALFNSAIGGFLVGSHSYLNARLYTEFNTYSAGWLKTWRFILGFILYESGFWLLVHSDSILRNLRPKGQEITAANRYKIPLGGGFEYVTNPQYLGELMAWTGALLYTSSPTLIPALCFSLANLVPRAFENHKWYLKRFPDYPKDRKVLIPFII